MAKKYQMALAANTMIKDQSLLRHEDIKQHIRILPELAAYIPPLLPEEFGQLEENIKKNGCREALLIWETAGESLPDNKPAVPIYILIDGHNRYAICQKNNIDFKVHLMSFPSIEDVKFFMIDNQLGRRNLAPEQVSYLRGLRYLREKQKKGTYLREDQKGQNDPFDLESTEKASEISSNELMVNADVYKTTAHRLGKQFNVSEKTIKRDAIYAQGLEQLTPEFKQDILAGKRKVDKTLIQQLGQLKTPFDPVSSQTELDRILQQAANELKPVAKLPTLRKREKTNQLKQQLTQLISKLDDEEANLKQLCEKIIYCAQQLQKQD